MEQKKLLELMDIIKAGDDIIFDNKSGIFKIMKLEDA